MRVNLLVVEDDLDEINDWKKIVSRHNLKSEFDQSISFHLEIANNIEEARVKINTYNFSVAIIDVRLKREEDTEGYNNTDGIDVLNEIMETTSCFAVIYTGQPKDAEDNINQEHKKYIKVIDRTTSKSALLNSLIEDEKDIVLSIHEMKNKFSKSMSSLFYKSIWPRWSYWLENSEQKPTEQALTRHMATHLHATFLNNDGQGAHPEEYFFIPPLQDNLDTGDIILQGDKLEIIVTPRCDMIRAKSATPTIQLVTLLDRKDDWESLKSTLSQKQAEGVQKKIDNALGAIKKFTNHNGETGGHFIQGFRIDINGKEQSFGPYYAQFNLLRSIERSDENIKNLLDCRIASLSNEFVPSLVERLGAYFSRIGTPDYSHPD